MSTSAVLNKDILGQMILGSSGYTSSLSIVVNNIDVTELCTSIEIYEEMELLIGNSVSTQIKIKLINEDNLLADLLDYPFIFNNKSYLVYSKPEKWTSEISLTLYDLMIKANVRYKTSLNYPCIVSNQLSEMATLMGVEIDISTLSDSVLNKTVGWIAECDGKNAFIENDKVVFKAIGQTTHETDFCSDYEKLETVTFSRVCFDDGVITPISVGSTFGRTLYVNPSNSYIELADVERIHTMYSGLSFTTIKSFDCFGLPGYKLTDLVAYDEMVILPIVQKVSINGGEAEDSVSFSCELKNKTADEVVIVDNTKNRIRRVQTQVNQLEGKYSVVAQDVDKNKEAIAKLELSADKFEVTVSKVEELEKEVRVTSIECQYGVSSSKTTEPTSWTDNRPTLSANQYLWMREKYTYSDGSVKYDGVRMISAEDGKAGTTIVIEYALSNSSTVAPASGYKGRLATPKIELYTIESSDSVSSTSAVLGVAVLGKMRLGEES